MTLKELDEALVQVFSFDFSKPNCIAARDQILEFYGKHLLRSKETICSRCWMKQHKGCRSGCKYNMSENPIEAAREYLSVPNDVNIFPFFYMFVFPLYEKETGDTGTMKRIAREYKRLLREREKKEEEEKKFLEQK